jgi:membrane protease subunit HflK
METVQQMYANTSKVMIDAKGSGNLLYLPLDKLMQATVGAAAAPVDAVVSEAPRAVSPAPTFAGDTPPQLERSVPGDVRSRDRIMSRERGER